MREVGVVLGGASCLWEDVKQLREIVRPEACVVLAVNDALIHWPGRVDHFCTLHPEEMGWRAERRALRGYAAGFTSWTRPYPHGLQEREKLCDRVLGGWGEGSSGLFAVGVALEGLGLRRVVLCGVPMDAHSHVGRAPAEWNGWATYRRQWEERHGDLIGAVRSFSGWTSRTLGVPARAWLTS